MKNILLCFIIINICFAITDDTKIENDDLCFEKEIKNGEYLSVKFTKNIKFDEFRNNKNSYLEIYCEKHFNIQYYNKQNILYKFQILNFYNFNNTNDMKTLVVENTNSYPINLKLIIYKEFEFKNRNLMFYLLGFDYNKFLL